MAGLPRERVEEFLLLELGHERLAGGDGRLELAGLVLEVAELPEALHDERGLGGEAFQQREVRRTEPMHSVALEVDYADHLIAIEHRRGHLAPDRGPHRDVAGLGEDIGSEERTAVEHAPAGDAVAEFQVVIAVIGGRADLHLGFKSARVGTKQGDGARIGVKRGDEQVEHLAQRGDLLAGLIGGLLAQTPRDPLLAAARGVVWHGLAADLLARAHGQTAVNITQLLDFLPAALHGEG